MYTYRNKVYIGTKTTFQKMEKKKVTTFFHTIYTKLIFVACKVTLRVGKKKNCAIPRKSAQILLLQICGRVPNDRKVSGPKHETQNLFVY